VEKANGMEPLKENPVVTLFGGGSWATALAKLLLNNRDLLNWYIRHEPVIESLRRYGHNSEYLSDVQFESSRLNLCNDINQAVQHAEVLIFAIPAAFLKDALEGMTQSLSGKFIISAIKGIIPDEDLIIADYFHRFHQVPYEQFGVIAGPCHAEEVALERLSYLTIASRNDELSHFIAGQLSCRYLHTFTSDDIIGTEYAAVLKNIFAIAAGICHGLGYGDNFQAVLISNSIREMERFARAVHPITRDIKDSAYLGDLMVTAYSKFSRNRVLGTMIGQGYGVKAALLETNMVAEGYYAVNSIWRINQQYKVDMPITRAVYNILYGRSAARSEIEKLTWLLS
jgi:glycerol-3-phosphate dehydrogenase (NAD(P)+)